MTKEVPNSHKLPPMDLDPWPTLEELREYAAKQAPEWKRRANELRQNVRHSHPIVDNLKIK